MLGQRVRRPLCAPQAPGALAPAGAPSGAAVPFYNPAQFAQVSALAVSPALPLLWGWAWGALGEGAGRPIRFLLMLPWGGADLLLC